MAPWVPSRILNLASPSSRTPLRALSLGLHLGIVLLAAWHGVITLSFYLANRFFTQDMAHIDYMLYHTWHGRFFWSIVYEAPHFSKHFTPTLTLLVPFHALFRHPLFLPLAETLALLSGAWAAAWMVDGVLRRGRGVRLFRLSPLGLAMGWLFAANPHTGSLLLAFHFESFAVALGLWALAALANRRMRAFWVLLVLAVGVKEDLALYWAVFGIWWFVFGWGAGKAGRWRRRVPIALAIVAFCAIWAVLAMLVIRWTAEASGQPAAEYAPRYAWLGATLGERVAPVVSHPKYLLVPLYNAAKLLLPWVLLLPLLAPSTLLLLIPAAYIMGLADVDSQYALYYYYSYPFLPFLFLGAALGLARLIRLSRKKNLFFQGFHAKRPLAALALAVIVAAACYSAIQPTRTDHFRRMPLKSTERHAWIRGILRERIPCGASVAAQFDLLAQLPYREAIYPLSEKNLGRAEYWVMDLQGFRGDVKADEMRRILERVDTLVREGKGEVMVDGQGLLIVRQKSED